MKQSKSFRVANAEKPETAMHELSQSASGLSQCPRCGKTTLSQIGSQFECIWCGFSRDLSQYSQNREASSSGFNFLFLFLVAFFVVLFLFG